MVDRQEIVEASAGKGSIPLSAVERAWLAEHKAIRFTGDPDWLPQEAFTSSGQYIGIVADILDLELCGSISSIAVLLHAIGDIDIARESAAPIALAEGDGPPHMSVRALGSDSKAEVVGTDDTLVDDAHSARSIPC